MNSSQAFQNFSRPYDTPEGRHSFPSHSLLSFCLFMYISISQSLCFSISLSISCCVCPRVRKQLYVMQFPLALHVVGAIASAINCWWNCDSNEVCVCILGAKPFWVLHTKRSSPMGFTHLYLAFPGPPWAKPVLLWALMHTSWAFHGIVFWSIF